MTEQEYERFAFTPTGDRGVTVQDACRQWRNACAIRGLHPVPDTAVAVLDSAGRVEFVEGQVSPTPPPASAPGPDPGIQTYSYVTVPGEPTTPVEAISAWRESAIRDGYMPCGNAQVQESTSHRGVLLVEGPARKYATVPEVADLDNWFSYHPPAGPEDIAAYQAIREAGKRFALVVFEQVPGSRERSEAWSLIRSAVMWANAGRACNGAPGDAR